MSQISTNLYIICGDFLESYNKLQICLMFKVFFYCVEFWEFKKYVAIHYLYWKVTKKSQLFLKNIHKSLHKIQRKTKSVGSFF